MTYATLETSLSSNILTVRLNRPERLNAFDARMLDDLLRLLDVTDRDDDIRAVVFTGSGTAFCAGADLSAASDLSTPEGQARLGLDGRRDSGGRVVLRLFESTKPLIAACNGAAVGFGATVQLAMDVRLAATCARYGFVFPRLGSVMEGCSSWFLPRLVGIQTAMEWVSSGRVFGADEALQRGLVRSVHPPQQLLDAALDVASTFVRDTSPVAVALNRRLMWAMLGTAHPGRAHRLESDALYALAGSGEIEEGVDAFLRKRAPRFPLKVSESLDGLLTQPAEAH